MDGFGKSNVNPEKQKLQSMNTMFDKEFNLMQVPAGSPDRCGQG